MEIREDGAVNQEGTHDESAHTYESHVGHHRKAVLGKSPLKCWWQPSLSSPHRESQGTRRYRDHGYPAAWTTSSTTKYLVCVFLAGGCDRYPNLLRSSFATATSRQFQLFFMLLTTSITNTFPNLAILHGSVNRHLHCYCEVSWSVIWRYTCRFGASL